MQRYKICGMFITDTNHLIMDSIDDGKFVKININFDRRGKSNG